MFSANTFFHRWPVLWNVSDGSVWPRPSHHSTSTSGLLLTHDSVAGFPAVLMGSARGHRAFRQNRQNDHLHQQDRDRAERAYVRQGANSIVAGVGETKRSRQTHNRPPISAEIQGCSPIGFICKWDLLCHHYAIVMEREPPGCEKRDAPGFCLARLQPHCTSACILSVQSCHPTNFLQCVSPLCRLKERRLFDVGTGRG